MRLSEKKINNFIIEKKIWITKKQSEVLQQIQSQPNYSFCENEAHPLLDNNFPIKIIEQQKVPLVFFNDTFYLSNLVNEPEVAFRRFYIQYAREYITKRVIHFAKTNNLEFEKIKINQAKTRWGSCSFINNLNFNYRLILTPQSVLDYVVIHELAHTVHKNHSVDFWNFVAIMLPEYKTAQQWLKEKGSALLIN
jgi:predicted metal-dependent hydrolase